MVHKFALSKPQTTLFLTPDPLRFPLYQIRKHQMRRTWTSLVKISNLLTKLQNNNVIVLICNLHKLIFRNYAQDSWICNLPTRQQQKHKQVEQSTSHKHNMYRQYLSINTVFVHPTIKYLQEYSIRSPNK